MDDFGRSLVTEYDNDVFRGDDDVCVENTFATSNTFPRVLNALSRALAAVPGLGVSALTLPLSAAPGFAAVEALAPGSAAPGAGDICRLGGTAATNVVVVACQSVVVRLFLDLNE